MHQQPRKSDPCASQQCMRIITLFLPISYVAVTLLLITDPSYIGYRDGLGWHQVSYSSGLNNQASRYLTQKPNR